VERFVTCEAGVSIKPGASAQEVDCLIESPRMRAKAEGVEICRPLSRAASLDCKHLGLTPQALSFAPAPQAKETSAKSEDVTT